MRQLILPVAALMLAVPGLAAAQDAAPAPAPTVDAASPAAPAGPAPTVVNNTLPPPPADTMNKSYPVCGHGVVDSCQNPGEGGAPGRSRASDYKGGPAKHPVMHHRRHRA